MAEKTPNLDDAYGIKTSDDNARLYADWAKTYDASFAAQMHYTLPEAMAEAFSAAGGSAPVLDLGAGTGLLGQALADRGVLPFDGTDISPQMLAVAEDKQLYLSLIHI